MGESMEFYRNTTLGRCMMNALDELINNETFNPELALRVVEQFDKSMIEALATVKSKTSFKGHLATYRYCEGVWTFILKDAKFITDGESQDVSIVKIVAADAKLVKRP